MTSSKKARPTESPDNSAGSAGSREPSSSNQSDAAVMTVKSTRFGEISVPVDSELYFPQGLIGFPQMKRYVILEHKPPFSWLHSLDDPALAFVIVDGIQFGDNYQVKPPVGDATIDLNSEDEFAVLVIVTVRPDPTQTTANLKAPLFVNVRNRKGIQIIFDDPRYSTRFALWAPSDEAAETPKSEDPSGSE